MVGDRVVGLVPLMIFFGGGLVASVVKRGLQPMVGIRVVERRVVERRVVVVLHVVITVATVRVHVRGEGMLVGAIVGMPVAKMGVKHQVSRQPEALERDG